MAAFMGGLAYAASSGLPKQSAPTPGGPGSPKNAASAAVTGIGLPSKPIKVGRIVVSSIDNANNRFRVTVWTAGRGRSRSPSWLVWGQVRVRGAWNKASSGRWTWFDVPAQVATAVAERYAVPALRRAPLATSLRPHWSVAGTTLRLRLSNQGDPPVNLVVTGVPTADSQGMGQLTLALAREGRTIDAPGGIYVGPIGVRTLAAGEHMDLDVELTVLFPELAQGGNWQLVCRYDGMAVVDATLPGQGAEHRWWALRFQDQLQLTL